MAWKNGGGATTEIARHPAEGEFLWRVSIADVDQSGPFSRFDGYDRHILMLSGKGMVLQSPGRADIRLDAPLTPRSFSGDWEINGLLTDGPVRDFNLMLKRGAVAGGLEVIRADRPFTASGLAYVAEGALEGAAQGDALLITGEARLTPSPSACVILSRLSC